LKIEHKKDDDMMLEIEVLGWDRHYNVGVEETKIVKPAHVVTSIKRSPHSCPVMENFI